MPCARSPCRRSVHALPLESQLNWLVREIVISNHQIYLDWLYIWSFMGKIGSSGTLKIILKRSLMNIPIIGLGMKLFDFISLHRNWSRDQVKTPRRIKRIFSGGPNMPSSLLVFPEGTTFSLETKTRSEEFAKKSGLMSFENCLLPRTTGLRYILNYAADEFDGFLDLTIAYAGVRKEHYPEDVFGLESVYARSVGPESIHIHVKYIPLPDIPFQDDEKFTQWMYDRFHEKDQYLEEFYRSGHFPGQVISKLPLATTSDTIYALLLSVISVAAVLWCISMACSLGINLWHAYM